MIARYIDHTPPGGLFVCTDAFNDWNLKQTSESPSYKMTTFVKEIRID